MFDFLSQTVTSCNYNGQSVTSIYYNGNIIWSAAHTVYYVIAGAVHTETKNMGADCLTPSTFTPSVDGATFQGWSETPGVASILTSKTMGTSDIILYAVYQYNTITTTFRCQSDSNTGGNNNGYEIDSSKYYNLSFSYKIHIWDAWYSDGGDTVAQVMVRKWNGSNWVNMYIDNVNYDGDSQSGGANKYVYGAGWTWKYSDRTTIESQYALNLDAGTKYEFTVGTSSTSDTGASSAETTSVQILGRQLVG